MEIGTLLEEPDRATAATYWDSTGLTGVELGRPKKTEGGQWGTGRVGSPFTLCWDCVGGQRGSWVKTAFAPLH